MERRIATDREEPMKPRVLVVEDEPVSRAFFLEVLAGLPVDAEAAASCHEAVSLAVARPHALWLVDAHLPDGDATRLLPRLRATSPAGIAVAHTAARDAGLHAALASAGCAAVLLKPVAAAALAAAVRGHLPAGTDAPAWDDDAALAALGGRPDGVRELRALYWAELPGTVARVQAAFARGDDDAIRGELHRLASACAFAGARRMGDAVRRLRDAPRDDEVLAAFLAAATQRPPL